MKYFIVAARMNHLLAANHMTATELSERSGVSKNSISQYVNGAHAPSTLNAAKIAKIFGVNPLWVMGYDVAEVPSVEDEILRKLKKLSEQNKVRVLERVDALLELQEEGQ